MNMYMFTVLILIIAGIIITWLIMKNTRLKVQNEEITKRLREQEAFLKMADQNLKDAFNSLSAAALKNNNESFVTLAKSTLETQVADAKGDIEKKQQAIDSLVKPLAESLGKFDHKNAGIRKGEDGAAWADQSIYTWNTAIY